MQVYKLCIKMILHMWKSILLFTAIFLALAILVVQNVSTDSKQQKMKVPVLLINEDKNSVFETQLHNFLKDYVTFPDISMEKESQIEESLFYDGIQCIIRIPNGFSEDYLNNQELSIVRFHFTQTNQTVLVEMLINQFLSTVRECQNKGKSMNEAGLAIQGLKNKQMDIRYEKEGKTKYELFALYVKYLSYAIFSIILFFTGKVLSYFRKDGIANRNVIAPVSWKYAYQQIALAAWLVGDVLTLLLYILGIIFTKAEWESAAVIVMGLNILLYSGFCVSVGFIFGVTIKSNRVMEFAQQMVAIGSSFLSGVFVDQVMLSSKVTVIARLWPTFWFVRVNKQASELEAVNFHILQDFAVQGGIIVCFTVVLFLISFIIAEKKIKVDL